MNMKGCSFKKLANLLNVSFEWPEILWGVICIAVRGLDGWFGNNRPRFRNGAGNARAAPTTVTVSARIPIDNIELALNAQHTDVSSHNK